MNKKPEWFCGTAEEWNTVQKVSAYDSRVSPLEKFNKQGDETPNWAMAGIATALGIIAPLVGGAVGYSAAQMVPSVPILQFFVPISMAVMTGAVASAATIFEGTATGARIVKRIDDWSIMVEKKRNIKKIEKISNEIVKLDENGLADQAAKALDASVKAAAEKNGNTDDLLASVGKRNEFSFNRKEAEVASRKTKPKTT